MAVTASCLGEARGLHCRRTPASGACDPRPIDLIDGPRRQLGGFAIAGFPQLFARVLPQPRCPRGVAIMLGTSNRDGSHG